MSLDSSPVPGIERHKGRSGLHHRNSGKSSLAYELASKKSSFCLCCTQRDEGPTFLRAERLEVQVLLIHMCVYLCPNQ